MYQNYLAPPPFLTYLHTDSKAMGTVPERLRDKKLLPFQEFLMVRGNCTRACDEASLVGTTFPSKTVELIYTCFIQSYSNLVTGDRNPGKSILKAC